MKRILKILSVVVAVVIVAGIAIGLRPYTHAFGSVFQNRYRSSAASAPGRNERVLCCLVDGHAVTSSNTCGVRSWAGDRAWRNFGDPRPG